ncbi:MAG: shikimate dehydrogenase [Sphingomonas bacterium]|nr:shikimate dehydrogenase [Sphingomonas bacterium]MDB5689828.1 shikimate dehydrogenase [Sphingomonas bacterium]
MILSGLIGRSILASRSPWLHEQEARAQGLALRYELFDFTARGLDDDALAPLLADLSARGFAGVNVTYPFKQAILPLLDELADSAATVGAVNTVAMRDGRLVGHNTDMSGFRDSVREGLPGVELGRVLQFGAGGAGAAVASGLLALGVGTVEICDVDAGRATALVDRLRARFGADRAVARSADHRDIVGVDGVVNTTPIGMASAPGSPIEAERLRPSMWVADIVYFPLETELLRTARALGCRTLDGSGMVVGQAAAAFEIITGHRSDKERMHASFAARS